MNKANNKNKLISAIAEICIMGFLNLFLDVAQKTN